MQFQSSLPTFTALSPRTYCPHSLQVFSSNPQTSQRLLFCHHTHLFIYLFYCTNTKTHAAWSTAVRGTPTFTSLLKLAIRSSQLFSPLPVLHRSACRPEESRDFHPVSQINVPGCTSRCTHLALFLLLSPLHHITSSSLAG